MAIRAVAPPTFIGLNSFLDMRIVYPIFGHTVLLIDLKYCIMAGC